MALMFSLKVFTFATYFLLSVPTLYYLCFEAFKKNSTKLKAEKVHTIEWCSKIYESYIFLMGFTCHHKREAFVRTSLFFGLVFQPPNLAV